MLTQSKSDTDSNSINDQHATGKGILAETGFQVAHCK